MFGNILIGNTLFEGMTAAEIETALSCLGAKEKTFEKDQVIFAEGDPVRYTGIVASGSVLIVKEDFYGNRYIQSTLRSPDLFAEALSCADVESFPITVVAAERATVLLVDCKKIYAACPGTCPLHSRLMSNMARLLARKNLALREKMDIVTRRTTREKLMAYLSSEAKQRESNEFEIPYNRQQLADFLGVERSALSVEIGRLRRENIIRSDKSRFVLLRC